MALGKMRGEKRQRISTRRFGISASVVATAFLLGACAAGQNKPQETIRSSGATAPADLQLTCSSETAIRLELQNETLLPISSAEVSPGVFRVDFNTSGGPAACLIDSAGTVLSVERLPAAPPA